MKERVLLSVLVLLILSLSLKLNTLASCQDSTWPKKPRFQDFIVPTANMIFRAHFGAMPADKGVELISSLSGKSVWRKKTILEGTQFYFYDEHYWVEVNNYPQQLSEDILIFYKDGKILKRYTPNHFGDTSILIHLGWSTGCISAFPSSYYNWIKTKRDDPISLRNHGFEGISGEYFYVELRSGYLGKFNVKTGKLTKVNCPNETCPKPVSYDCQTLVVDSRTSVPLFDQIKSRYGDYYPFKDTLILAKLKPKHKVVMLKKYSDPAFFYGYVSPVAEDGVKAGLKGFIHMSTVRCL